MISRRDKDGNGTLDKEEVKEALQALGFTFIEDGDVDRIFKKADADKNGAWPLRERTRFVCNARYWDPSWLDLSCFAEVIDFEEFVKESPKTLRVSLVKLAKQNGHDLGFLA